MSAWLPLSELPDLRRVGIIALDLETKDDGLLAGRGSGWPWGAGYICGVSIAYRIEGDVRAHYFPLRHPDSNNFNPEQVHGWLRDLIASDVRIVTHSGLYDWGWFRAEMGLRMPPSERMEEIGALATIVDENRYRYSLDALSAWRGLPGKDEAQLKQAVIDHGFPKKTKPQSVIWQLPAHCVGPYAEADAVSTLALFESLDPVLEREGTREAYRLEIDLLPMVLEMRRRGVRIDVSAAEQAREQLLRKRAAAFAELSEKLGTSVGMAEIGRTKWLAETFDQQGITYPRTEKGNPSFTSGPRGWMHKHSHWLPQLIIKADKYNNAAVNVLGTYILGHVVNGRVHAEIHPHRSDEGGTRSLRFSYSNPPLQLMPSRDEELAPLIRGVFLPEEGETWAKPDISQQEFRLIVHYSVRHKLRGAHEAADYYRNNPDADFHKFAAELTELARKDAKGVNFANVYGAGVRTLAQMIGKSEAEARIIKERYDRALPFVAQLAKLSQYAARRLGYLTLYDGALRHWGSWAPGGTWKKGSGPCAREEAERRAADPHHPWYQRRLWRADTHKACNALIQGSAARHTKLWMRACWREGVVPLLQMHDALECSVSSREQAELVAQLGCEAVKLEVPMLVDLKFGRTWGDAVHTWEELNGDPTSKVNSCASTTTVQSDPPIVVAPIIVEAPTIVDPPTPTTIEAPTVVEAIIDPFERLTQIPLADLIGQKLANGKVCCPFHDDSTPSCHIYPDHFYCFACNARGDHITWLTEVEGLSHDEAIETLLNWSGPIARPQANNDTSNFERAMRLWNAGQPVTGTPAAKYLIHRGITALPAHHTENLRFHPSCPFNGRFHPCLLALFRDVESDAPAGIHRIAITVEGKKLDKRMLGRWPTPRAIKLWSAGTHLVVAEGIETTLAGARFSHRGTLLRPAWAMGSRVGIERLPVLPGIERLIILVDNDANNVGINAARTCASRWLAAGHTVVLLIPHKQDADFNDIASSTCHEVHPH
jgi:DNA polymerase I-like protein with 3'-5' exonuclease and polymerase domains